MRATLRAATSLLALIGFYLLAFGLVVGLVAGALAARKAGVSAAATRLTWVAIVAAVGIVVALWKVVRFRPQPPAGVDVPRSAAPELWALVDELAAAVGTRGPSQILLDPEINASVTEETRFMGLVGGPRRLYLGVPLLQGLSVPELRAVIGHEIGHYSSAHTRLGPIAYRGYAGVIMTVVQLRGSVVGWLLRQYAKFYLLVTKAVSRAQELEADRVAVVVAGRAAAQGALRELPVLGTAWRYYTENYIKMGWGVGLAPTAHDVFDGFARLLEGRDGALANLRAEAPPAEGTAWDSHPPIAERVAAIERQPEPPLPPADQRGAAALIPGFEHAAAAVAEAFVAFGERERVSWEELVARILAVRGELFHDGVMRAAAQVAGTPGASVGTLLDLADAGRADDVVRAFAPDYDDEERAEAWVPMLQKVVEAALVGAGVAYWRLSWTGPATLARTDGVPLGVDLEALFEKSATPVADLRTYLAGAGVDLRTPEAAVA